MRVRSEEGHELWSERPSVVGFGGWPAVEPDAAHGCERAGDNRASCISRDGGREYSPQHVQHLAHEILHPTRYTGARWLLLHRCEFLIQSRGQEYIGNVSQSFFNLSELARESQISTERNSTTGHDVLSGESAPAAAMFSPVVQAVLQMGFDQPLVESLVQSHFLLTGYHYISVSELVADILQAEEDGRQGSDNNTEPEVRQSSSTSGVNPQTSFGEKVLVTVSSEEQLKKLQEERTCKVCMDKLVSMVFIPCGHLVVCSECAASLRNCPICRAVIRGSMRAFMS
ncbi:baculoviral IAP repeat-containing protein 7 isoform X2 [Tachysurus fulvidraco]|uniref:baculoviral IAP repeat-containing protein 7 isoform X2 n=1 Tax=Tachysurus fulvidraco TaxID=1234273 RepID=UPI000F4F55D0|nr:baculoviral IAP repeat-containing protein 7 isoform X2 [Tachysurus fulvidraco]